MTAAAFDQRAAAIRFDPSDLDHAWEAHGHHHAEIAALGPERTGALERDYTSALADLLRTDEPPCSTRGCSTPWAVHRGAGAP